MELRRLLSVVVTVWGVLFAAMPEGLAVATEDAEAVQAVEASLSVERTMLQEDLERYRSLAAERTGTLQRLQERHQALERALMSESADAAQAVERVLQELEILEAQRREQVSRERAAAEQIRERMRRIALLEAEYDRLRARMQETAGPLEGNWDVVLLPLNQRGIFRLRQEGTLLRGTYELEGGWTGSLQGTFVGRKVRLIRIDSKLGRSMELEGYLSADRNRIRGTWLSYELASGDSSSGSWSAKRQADDGS